MLPHLLQQAAGLLQHLIVHHGDQVLLLHHVDKFKGGVDIALLVDLPHQGLRPDDRPLLHPIQGLKIDHEIALAELPQQPVQIVRAARTAGPAVSPHGVFPPLGIHHLLGLVDQLV